MRLRPSLWSEIGGRVTLLTSQSVRYGPIHHLISGRRAAAIISLIQSVKLNVHEPYAYLKDVLARLPTQKASAIHKLLPHNWKPIDDA